MSNGGNDKDVDDLEVTPARREILTGVGYRQPPEHTRFQKGQSGNPRGRPRSAPADLSFSDQAILAAAHRAANKKVRVREGDHTKEVTAQEALLDAAIAYGLKGNARYAGLAIDLIRTAEQARKREIRESNMFWQTYKATRSAELAEALRQGKPAPVILPHPDDIVIDVQDGPRFLGPLTADEQKSMEESLALRDILILQAALDDRLIQQTDSADLRRGPGSAFLFAVVLNRILPPRLQMSELSMATRMDYFSRRPKRRLLKQVHEAWGKVGKRFRRGSTFPALGYGISQVQFLLGMLGAIREGSLDATSTISIQNYIEDHWPCNDSNAS